MQANESSQSSSATHRFAAEFQMLARRLTTRHFVILGIAGLTFVGRVAFIVLPSAGTQLLIFAMVVAFPFAIAASVWVLVREWRTLKWMASMPLAIYIAAMPLSGMTGDAARDFLFTHNLPIYEAMVARSEVQQLRPGERISLELPRWESADILGAEAERMSDGTLLVELLYGGGFPVKHCSYLYTSSGQIPEDLEKRDRWPHRQMMNAHWAHVSD